MKDPRQLAFETLLKLQKHQSYSNLSIAGVLGSSDLSGADKSFFTTLVYGVLERKLTLDYNLSLYLKQPLKKLNPNAYAALLLGAYQVLFLEKVPDHAAINESVKLTRKNGASFASGLCNAVLRKVASNGLCLPEAPAAAPEDGRPLTDKEYAYYSVLYSVPVPLIRLWVEAYGFEKTEGILKDALGPRPLTVRVNTTRTTAEELIARLETEGVTAVPHEAVGDALILESAGDLAALPSFRDGLFHVQDAASQLCCANVAAEPGMTVYDLCAAPGGKSCTLAEYMENKGVVRAVDLYEKRVGLIAENAERLGLSIVEPAVGDATEYDPERPPADRVLCDVPCAGYGDIGRKPEIRFKDPGSVDIFPALQYDILDKAEQYVVDGGRLVYSTCSLNPAENEAVAERFLEEHDGWKLVLMKTYFPQDYHCDGFFNAVFEKAREG